MLNLVRSLASRFVANSTCRFSTAFLLLSLSLPLLFPLAAHAQEDSNSGQNDPGGQQQDPNNPNPGGPNDPEESAPVVLTASVAPDRVPITSGTATLTWSGRNARYCSVDGTSRAASGSVTVGSWTTAGTKTFLWSAGTTARPATPPPP